MPHTLRQYLALMFVILLWSPAATADFQKILVEKEIDDDNIIVLTERGDRLLLEKWTLRFSPLLFEGRIFQAEVSPLWVTIHFDGRDPIKWSVEEVLSSVGERANSPQSDAEHSNQRPKAPRCYETSIQAPSPFNGNGGELIQFSDGTIWQEVSYQYLYLYEYYPTVIVCPSEGKMILDEHVFQIIQRN